MTITLRQETADGATTKGSALTYAELDNNFVHLLRQGSVTVRGDSGTDQTLGEADVDSILQIAGGTGISTAISSDSAGETVLTINSSGGGITDVNAGDDMTVDVDSAGGVTVNHSRAFGGDISGGGNTLSNIDLKQYTETVYAIGSNDSPALDMANGNVQTVTISAGLALPTISNMPVGGSMTLIVSGSGSITTSTDSAGLTYKFAEGNKTLTTESVVSIFYDGTTYYASVATNFAE